MRLAEPDGHGQNGAPFHIRHILHEMETHDEKLHDLKFLSEEHQQISDKLN